MPVFHYQLSKTGRLLMSTIYTDLEGLKVQRLSYEDALVRIVGNPIALGGGPGGGGGGGSGGFGLFGDFRATNMMMPNWNSGGPGPSSAAAPPPETFSQHFRFTIHQMLLSGLAALRSDEADSNFTKSDQYFDFKPEDLMALMAHATNELEFSLKLTNIIFDWIGNSKVQSRESRQKADYELWTFRQKKAQCPLTEQEEHRVHELKMFVDNVNRGSRDTRDHTPLKEQIVTLIKKAESNIKQAKEYIIGTKLTPTCGNGTNGCFGTLSSYEASSGGLGKEMGTLDKLNILLDKSFVPLNPAAGLPTITLVPYFLHTLAEIFGELRIHLSTGFNIVQEQNGCIYFSEPPLRIAADADEIARLNPYSPPRCSAGSRSARRY